MYICYDKIVKTILISLGHCYSYSNGDRTINYIGGTSGGIIPQAVISNFQSSSYDFCNCDDAIKGFS